MGSVSRQVLLGSIQVGDDAGAWRAAGFAVEDDAIGLGGVTVTLRGDGSRTGWTLVSEPSGQGDVDGIPTTWAEDLPAPAVQDHPMGAAEIDHIVVATPDLDRTTSVLEGLGLPCRRVRDTGSDERPMQQRFFRMGPVIIEMVGSPTRTSDGPASIWGLALTVEDLDAAATHLGAACGRVKEAVQPGRRIATVRSRDLGVSVPIALMSPEPGTQEP